MGAGNTLAYWMNIGDNTIHLNQNLAQGTSNQAIAALIAHEALHADYSYYPAKWIAYTRSRYPALPLVDIHIYPDPWEEDTIDQEYTAYGKQVAVWNALKEARVDANNDAWAAYYAQGEADMKAEIRLLYNTGGTVYEEF
jgi:hypothetical protein